MEKYELELDEARLEISLEISKKYLTSSSIESGDNPGNTVIDVLNDDVIEHCKNKLSSE